MSVTKDQILDAIAAMSVMEVVELVSAMEEKFGVSAAAASGGGAAVCSRFAAFCGGRQLVCRSDILCSHWQRENMRSTPN